MADLELTSTRDGWQIQDGDLTVEASSARLDRGVVRATLTVRTPEGIRYRNRDNLTSEKSRSQIVAKLAAVGDGEVMLQERVLIALDEACRTRPLLREEAVGDAPADAPAGPPLDLKEMLAVFSRRLRIADPDFLVILVGAILAHRLGGDPVWLLIVAPPGGTKTEALRALFGHRSIFPLSDLTARTFASGLDTDRGDPSLLSRLGEQILVLKDLTTVLEMTREERQAILAQLREIYDGRFDKAWGTGQEIHWEGRLGLIAGVTPVIDRHQAVLATLGERFVYLRPTMAERRALALSALRTAGRESEMRRELSEALHGFLDARRIERPVVGPWVHDTLAVTTHLQPPRSVSREADMDSVNLLARWATKDWMG